MKMSKIIIGAMRFKDRKSAVDVVRKAIDNGFNYIDTSPFYCYKNEKENSESWIGEAVNYKDYRQRVMISTKCTPGNGGLGLGDFTPEKSFGARSIEQLKIIFQQSLDRLNLPDIDYYHLWTCHTDEQFQEAFKPDGWYDGVKFQQDKFKHLGLTTHADAETAIKFLKTDYFKTVTIPFNVINTTRLKVIEHCNQNQIKVIAMNPLAGGLLTANEKLKELALRYLMNMENVHILIGFSSIEEVEYAKWIENSTPDHQQTTEDILAAVDKIIDSKEPRCTSCGYCQPCPQFINVGACLSFYNLYKYLHLKDAKKTFLNTQWNERFNLKNCTMCGLCEERCPNNLPVGELLEDARKLLYNNA